MKNGFPDYHQFPDRDHGDESFWPSFTDIMMVITMVFLLVTVMAITNNWKLVTDLKTSIQAQRIAAEKALDKEAKNHSLEDQMVMLQKRLVEADKIAVDKQVANQALQDELSRILAKISTIEQALEASLKRTQARDKQLAISSQQVDALKADRDKQLATLQARAQALSNLQGIQETSQQQVARLQAALDQKQAELLATQQDNKAAQLQLAEAQGNVLQQQAALKANASLLASKQESETQLTNLREKLKQAEATLTASRESQQVSEEKLQAMRTKANTLAQEKLDGAGVLDALRVELAQLRDLRKQDETRLESLKGEYDSLDSKYQKLVRPARSSNGKQVVSVWFSKQSGSEVYRIRDSSQGSFETTTRKGMTSRLAALKDKHGKALYVKVIIPENSNLSYSDAWRFTTEMQRAYDYYYQDDE